MIEILGGSLAAMIRRYGAFVAVLGIALAVGLCEFTGCFGFCGMMLPQFYIRMGFILEFGQEAQGS